VLDADNRVIDLAHRFRIFTGCGLHRCQIDHIVGWADGGVTTPANAGPRCPRHNRWKSRSYRC
jgi:hypothetical protein